jgi:nitrilase
MLTSLVSTLLVVFFDLSASLGKALSLIREAAAHGATLIVFPEVFLPGYPFFIWLESYGEWVAKRQDYHTECPLSDGPESLALVNIAKELQVTIVMGCSERDHGTLYMGQWIVGPEGILLQRRKLKPTLVER